MQFIGAEVLFWSETTGCVTDLMKAELCIILIHTFRSWCTHSKCVSKAHKHVFSLHLSNLLGNRYLVLFSKVFPQRGKFVPFCKPRETYWHPPSTRAQKLANLLLIIKFTT